MPFIFTCIPHCLLHNIAVLLHISFPSERQYFSKSELLLLHKASGFTHPYPLRWPSRIFAALHWCISYIILLFSQTETYDMLNTMRLYCIIQKKLDFAGSSSATHFISAIIFHCLGLTHEIKVGKQWFKSDNNLLCNIFVLLTEGNNYNASLLSDAKNLGVFCLLLMGCLANLCRKL